MIQELEMALIFNFLDVQSSVAAKGHAQFGAVARLASSLFPFCCVCRWVL